MKYDRDSLRRALENAVAINQIKNWTCYENGNYVISVHGQAGAVELRSGRETWLFAIALASAAQIPL